MEITCCLIGEDSLVKSCGNRLLDQGHVIQLVISSEPLVKEWADDNKIAWIPSLKELKVESLEVDYLFSIVNSQVLPSSVLQCARQYAINYHDSLLPKYAGLNATTWAILHNEKEHGITWHLMDEQIDKGDILIQEVFPIKQNDTALSLNLRCYEHAISSFGKLLDNIEQNKLSFTNQISTNRSFYTSNHYLPYFGFINWEMSSAEEIERTCRAVSLGRYNNNVGSLKLLLDNDYYIVSQVEVIEEKPRQPTRPGTLLSIDEEGLTVATKTHACKLKTLLSKTGEILSLSALFQQIRLEGDFQFPYLSEFDASPLKKIHNLAKKGEDFWVKRISEITEHDAFPKQRIHKDKQLTRLEPSISLKTLFPNKVFPNKKILLFATVLVYLCRLNNHEQIAISLYSPVPGDLKGEERLLFSSFLPFFFAMPEDLKLKDSVRNISDSLAQLGQYPTFLSDLTARHPLIKENNIDTGFVVNLQGETNDYYCQDNTVLYFNINDELGEMEVLHRLDLSNEGANYQPILANCIQHMVSILINLISHPHLNANKVGFLTQSERYQLVHEWGKGKKSSIDDLSLPALFSKQVIKDPQKTAIYTQHQTISYRDLSERADQVASFLRNKKLPKQALVGIYFHRSIEMIAVILGILKAECVYVPIDPHYPLLKIQQIIDDTSLSYLLTEDEMSRDLLSFCKQESQNLTVVKASELFVNQSISALDEEEAVSNKLAYIMFTSGTTGRPKGVVVTQKNIINYCKWFTETTQFTEESIIDFSSSIAFDLSIPCTLAPLIAGGSIAIASEAQKKNPKHYLLHLKSHRVTHTELTPGYLEMLLNYPDDIMNLVDLRFLMLGADIVPVNDVMRWLSLCPAHQIVNEYGPTETTVSVTSYFVNKESIFNEKSVPIGRPAYNSTCYVLDKHKNLCSAGVKGELYVGGAQVTQGYLNQEHLTQERFFRFNLDKANELVYKTGDIVSWLPDGNLQFFGRDDHQVKIQGYRVELPAIESTLIKMPGILQAVVVVMIGKLKENYLRAYLVIDSMTKSTTEIRDFLSDYLPSYMIPREFCVIKSIPLKENEKIDFSALEQKNYQLLTYETKIQTTGLSTTEEVLERIWEQLFHSTNFTIHDDFFDIGGDSLMAMQLISELKKHYSITIPLQVLFEQTSIAKLAKQIDSFIQMKSNCESIFIPKSLVKLSQGPKSSVPLFLIHPVGGSVFWYKKLAAYLDEKYTIYGIQDITLDGANLCFKTLESMASYYLQEIKKIYSGDDFYLGGASFGATVAFEIAHQLLRENKTVKFLGLFDGWAHYPEKLMQENTLHWLSHREEREPPLDPAIQNQLNTLELYRKELLLNYKVLPLNTNANLFKASELWSTYIPIDDPENGWGSYILGELACYKMPGNHETMFFEPHVQNLAKELDKILSTAEVGLEHRLHTGNGVFIRR